MNHETRGNLDDAARHRRVGDALRAARKARRYSQQDIANAADVSVATVRNIEAGAKTVTGAGSVDYATTPETLARIAAAAGLDIRQTLIDYGFEPTDLPLEHVELSDGDDVTIVAVRIAGGAALSEEAQERIRAMVAEIVRQDRNL